MVYKRKAYPRQITYLRLVAFVFCFLWIIVDTFFWSNLWFQQHNLRKMKIKIPKKSLPVYTAGSNIYYDNTPLSIHRVKGQFVQPKSLKSRPVLTVVTITRNNRPFILEVAGSH